MRDPRWRVDAMCGQVLRLHLFGLVAEIPFDPNLWYPDTGRPGFLAKRICAACPARESCLSHALAEHEEFGVWGGAGESIRRQLTRLATNGQWDLYRKATLDHFDRLDHLARTGRQPAGAQKTFGPGATHGNAATAAKGCRCRRCRLAQAVRTQTSRRIA